MASIVETKDLRTYFRLDEGVLKAVDGVSLAVAARRTLGIIGESGCGKSVTAQSILRIVPAPGEIVGGQILFCRGNGVPVDLAALDGGGAEIRAIRGRDISMIFQEPMTSLSPVHTIGNQVMEAILLHRTRDTFEAREIAVEMLGRVGISNPSQRFHEYPHQLSGGMRQRAMIAMALCCHPALLIADEPTTALDVTVQAQILELITELQAALGMSVLYITHDLGVIAEIADEVAVMYLGRVVEQGTSHDIFKDPLHPYTSLLLRSIPRLGRKARVRLEAIKGTVPMPLNPPWQCGFYSRCPARVAGRCDVAVPALVAPGRTGSAGTAGATGAGATGDGAGSSGHRVRCFLHAAAEEPRPAVQVGGGRRRRVRRAPAAPAQPIAGAIAGGKA